MSIMILAISAVILATNCKPEEEDSEATSVTAPFLNLADVTPGTVKTLDETELRFELDNESDFYANEPEEADTSVSEDDAEMDKCWTNTLDTNKVSAAGDTISLGFQADLTKCFNEAFNSGSEAGVSVQITGNVNVTLYFKFRCVGADFSQYDGKSFSEIADLEVNDDNCTESSGLMNSKFVTDIKGSFSFGGESHTFETASSVMAVSMKSDSSPCKSTKVETSWHHEDGCLTVSRTKTTRSLADGVEDAEELKDDYTKLANLTLVEKDDDTSLWYESGSFDVQINNWSGSMTYNGADTGPSFSLSDGTSTAAGTLSATTTTATTFAATFASPLRSMKQLSRLSARKLLRVRYGD
jgi:hypothetical protein